MNNLHYLLQYATVLSWKDGVPHSINDKPAILIPGVALIHMNYGKRHRDAGPAYQCLITKKEDWYFDDDWYTYDVIKYCDSHGHQLPTFINPGTMEFAVMLKLAIL